MGLFASRDSMYLTALAVFIPSYIAVISGCWWWVKAKNWHEAVVFIGLMPLGVFCIRYVRLIYIAIPLLFPATMVLMPILLVGVVAVLLRGQVRNAKTQTFGITIRNFPSRRPGTPSLPQVA